MLVKYIFPLFSRSPNTVHTCACAIYKKSVGKIAFPYLQPLLYVHQIKGLRCAGIFDRDEIKLGKN
jgi:hypothetical protein